MLWSATISGEEGRETDLGDVAARGRIGLVPDEASAITRIAQQDPAIAVRTDVEDPLHVDFAQSAG